MAQGLTTLGPFVVYVVELRGVLWQSVGLENLHPAVRVVVLHLDEVGSTRPAVIV